VIEGETREGYEADKLKAVNHYLSDYLFLDRGYQIDFDHLIVLPSSIYRDIVEEDLRYELKDLEVVVRIFLRDSNGLRLCFEDVGSGLGYVFPVLVSLAMDVETLYLQQPELHLHPALQAAIGDVLIDAKKSHENILVETHSEHLILRLLKRIRQTHAGSLPSPDFELLKNEIRFLFFETLPTGATRVKSIGVAENGEFTSRWPSGFFAEREAELFDE
jgi:predicted ATPase